MSQCELIIKEVNDWNNIQDLVQDNDNPDKGNLRIQIQYNKSGDTFLQKFQGLVNHHDTEQASTYTANYSLPPYNTISPNHCGIITTAEILKSDITFEGMQTLSIGASLTTEADTTTIRIDTFLDIWGYCHRTTKYFAIQNNQMIIKDQNNTIISQQNFPTANDVAYGGDSNFTTTIEKGIKCDGKNCTNFTIAVNLTDPAIKNDSVRGTLYFLQPLPAQKYTTIDGIIWNSLGSTIVKSHKK